MTSFVLKLIAITTMLIDHFGAIFIPSNTTLYWVCRGIGRIAFPIFVFLIVEGFHHTSNVKKYLTRLGIFALVSELPFDLAFYQYSYRSNFFADFRRLFILDFLEQSDAESSYLFKTIYIRFMLHQNVFFTLFIGLLLITLMSKIKVKFQNKIIVSVLLQALFVFVACYIAVSLKTDYDSTGILLITAFYLFRKNILLMSVSTLILLNGFMSVILAFSIRNLSGIDVWLRSGGIYLFTVISMICIAYYNGKKGKNIKYIFYAFYPAHLLILFFVHSFLQ